ncbi:uncharacterized protein LOC121638788 isoform X2 [Melanotaenia boesemani]|uniref:uncharacterized protein LOC121638788 isoform X2 n=1 Tax=Melanotaenia boesemani TaxID=1250792 RepID=UPI001C04CEAD|nr:uncharacterized protein LOC121638788 isoform X2 [Melanotaenia boesemani]
MIHVTLIHQFLFLIFLYTKVMDEDLELESAMLNISPSKLSIEAPAAPLATPAPVAVSPAAEPAPAAVLSRPPAVTVTEPQASTAGASTAIKQRATVPLPPQLAFLAKEGVELNQPESVTGPSTSTAASSAKRELVIEDTSEDAPSAQPQAVVPPPDYDMGSWNCSPQQKLWMKMELKDLGLWPGSGPVRNPGNTISLWRLPPQPELMDTVADLPSPNFFQLHPFFLWKPESDFMVRLRNNYILPCLYGCTNPQVVSSGVGRPRVIVGTSGQYYILASRLRCRVCQRRWFADNPCWLEKLSKRFTNILPAFVTYKKAICRSVMDELRRTGKSPADMANQINELIHLKYERAHLACLHAIENVQDAEAGRYGQQRTISQFVRKDNTPRDFGPFDDPSGWRGVTDRLSSRAHLGRSSDQTTRGKLHKKSHWPLGSCPATPS